MQIREFRHKWDFQMLNFLIKEFVRRTPAFPQDQELAKLLGEAMADLEDVLRADLNAELAQVWKEQESA